MEKSKIGITVGLLGMIMFLMGTANVFGAVLIAAYILLRETNDWLKHSAVKCLVILVIFESLSCVIGVIDSTISIATCIDAWNGFSKIKMPYNIYTILYNCIHIVENVLLLILAFKALSMKTLRIKPIDNLLEKHGSKYVQKVEEPEFKQCPQCGQRAPKNALFCPKCGNRFQ